jgi:hypothetical protein
LFVAPIYVLEISKVGHQGMMYGMLFDKIHMEFYGLF